MRLSRQEKIELSQKLWGYATDTVAHGAVGIPRASSRSLMLVYAPFVFYFVLSAVVAWEVVAAASSLLAVAEPPMIAELVVFLVNVGLIWIYKMVIARFR